MLLQLSYVRSRMSFSVFMQDGMGSLIANRSSVGLDLSLGVDIFGYVILTNWWSRKKGTPTAFFGWVLAGLVQGSRIAKSNNLATFHVALKSSDALLLKKRLCPWKYFLKNKLSSTILKLITAD